MASGAVRRLAGELPRLLHEQVRPCGRRVLLGLDRFGEGVQLFDVKLADGNEAVEVGLPLHPHCRLAVVL